MLSWEGDHETILALPYHHHHLPRCPVAGGRRRCGTVRVRRGEAVKLFAERDLELYVQDRIAQKVTEIEGNHAWEVRRLTARAEDAERERDKFRGAYKRSLAKLGRMRKSLARARQNLQAAGLGKGEPQADGSPDLSTVQGVIDVVNRKIPGIDAMAQEQTRLYIEREFRSRGAKAGPMILEEVLAGDIPE